MSVNDEKMDELLREIHARSQTTANKMAIAISVIETLKLSSMLNSGTGEDVVKAVQEMMRE